MHQELEWKDLAKRLDALLADKNKINLEEELKDVLEGQATANIALAMEELSPEHSCQVIEALDVSTATEVLAKLEPERTNKILELHPERLPDLIKSLPPREAAAIITDIPSQLRKAQQKIVDVEAVEDAQNRLCYPRGSVGRLMTTQFVRLEKGTSIAKAINIIKSTDPAIDIPDDVYVVEELQDSARYHLLGVISIREILMSNPHSIIDDVMATDVISVAAVVDETDAAAILSKYKFMSLPVTDQDGYLVGVVPADDLMPIIVNRLRQLYTQAVGTDAENMEKLSPLQAAKIRVPWLLGTMLIELIAGMIISHFDSVLQKIILLTSFMPVISAISGNVGLQAAAITVRALDMKSTKKNIWISLKKEGLTTLLMAVACGLVLGTIGAIWAKHIPFGIVIGIALTCSMLTAGLMGTVIPSVSKKLGFDPATTAGPFETAFQDIIGFGVFLGLATFLQHWII
ncbi:magnesium transporter [Pedobacter montanisoli]|uniref:Magnesium transporter MgtE n=1 Tax=Pedobacter montanisoli TaxID=2923277 RepID=A0ABS9ZVP8_9SPHI|nr:magnesium transporter [Pedobacter montanisoli]MCJ0742375.1 magnesium transporter [Pedobacter montanisoli]